MTIENKAAQLIEKFGKSVAQDICNLFIDEYAKTKWNQERIDFYLDVKNQITKIK